MQSPQAQRRFVDAVVHPLAGDEIALARVGPAVIRANDRADMAGIGAAELRAAVATNVVERAHLALVVAYHQHRSGIDGEGQEVAGFGHLEGKPGEQPAVVPDLLHLESVERIVVIERARQAVAFAARAEKGVEFGGQGGHDGLLTVWKRVRARKATPSWRHSGKNGLALGIV